MEKAEAIRQVIELMQQQGVSLADLMRPLADPNKISQVHITGGRWIEELSPVEWAARGMQGERPSDTYEMEFDTPLAVAPDGSLWAWIGPSAEILPDKQGT